MRRSNKCNYLAILCTLLCSISTTTALSENYDSDTRLNIEVLDYSKGLPISSVRRVVQDSDCVTWVGTNGGVLHYDGHKFTTIETYSNNVYALLDAEDRVYIGTNRGLSYIDKLTKKLTPITGEPFDNVRVEHLVYYGDQILIAALDGLYLYTPPSAQISAPTTRLYQRDIKRVLVDSQNRVWFVAWNNGPMIYDFKENRAIEIFHDSRELANAYTLFEDAEKNIWIGYVNDGLARVIEHESGFHLKFYSNNPEKEGSLANNTIYSIAQNRVNGELWIGTRRGVSILKDIDDEYSFDNHILRDPYSSNIIYDYINSIFQDESGIIWLSSLYNGIVKINPNQVLVEHNALRGISSEPLNSTVLNIAYVDDQTYYINLKGQGLFCYNPKTNKAYSVEQHLRDIGKSDFYSIARSELRDLQYIPEQQMLICRNVGRGSYYQIYLKDGKPCDIDYIEPNSGESVKYIFIDSALNKWIFTKNDVAVWRHDELLATTPAFMHGDPKTFAQDQSGNIWIGTEDGSIYNLSIDERGVSVKYEYCDVNNKYEVLSLYCDHAGNVWAGTFGNGLLYFDAQHQELGFVEVNEKYNIDSNTLFNVFGDNSASIFVSDYNGIMHIDTKEGCAYQHPNSSLSKNSFDPITSFCQVDDSLFLLGGLNGYNKLNVYNLTEEKYVPNVIIADIQSGGGESVISCDNYRRNGKYSYSLTLPKCNNNVEFHFAALNYSDPTSSNYSYMLKGVDVDWRKTNAMNRVANYTHLPKGKYEFRLKATNDNGIWSEVPVTCQLIIRPAIYECHAAYILYIILIAILIWGVFKYIQNRIQLRIRLLDIENQQRHAAEINELKLRFFTNISHELLTPLSIINCSIEELSDNGAISKDQRRVMSSNVERLIRLIRQIIEFRKVETNNIKLKVANQDIVVLVENICRDSFQAIATQKHMHLSFVKHQPSIEGYFDHDKIDKILHNLLSNAFKYNKSGGYVLVSVMRQMVGDEDSAIITVQDNGIGIDETKKESIFNRFYDGEYRKTGVLGSGIGLSLSKELASLHLGQLTVQSEIGRGSTFTLTIPLSREAYQDRGVEIYDASAPELSPDSSEINEQEEPLSDDSCTILLVEDDLDMQGILAKRLYGAYKTYTASDGLEALKVLSDHNIDVVITDAMMPNMNGLELSKHLKNDVNLCHIPIIMLTARHDNNFRAEAYDIGVNAFISKPFSLKVLQSRISNLLLSRTALVDRYKKEPLSQLTKLVNNEIDRKIINNIVSIIKRNISNEEFSWAEISEQVNLSQSTVYRKIKAITGMSPADFIRVTRLKEAQTLLRGSEIMAVSEVAYAVGYVDPRYFSMCFKKEFGVTPSQYSKQLEK